MSNLARVVNQPSTVIHGAAGISASEFYEAFHRVWKPIAGPGGGPKPHIGKLAVVSAQLGTDRCQLGIAVSGGVDSMALAALCVNLKARKRKTFRPVFHAFIVDHKARPGSHEEAATVASRLKRSGMPRM